MIKPTDICFCCDELKNIIFTGKSAPIFEGWDSSKIYVTEEHNGFFIYEEYCISDSEYHGKQIGMRLVHAHYNRDEAIIVCYEYGKQRLEEFKLLPPKRGLNFD